MVNIINNLIEFIEVAEKSRKYPGNTASARKSAVRLFGQELNEQEKISLDTLKSNIEQIYQNVFNKNKASMTVASLQTYKARFLALIKDYEKYGSSPTAMASWNRQVRKVVPKTLGTKKDIQSETSLVNENTSKDTEMSRFELPLRPGVKAIILVPSNISKTEVQKMRKYIDFLDSISSDEINNGQGTPEN